MTINAFTENAVLSELAGTNGSVAKPAGLCRPATPQKSITGTLRSPLPKRCFNLPFFGRPRRFSRMRSTKSRKNRHTQHSCSCRKNARPCLLPHLYRTAPFGVVPFFRLPDLSAIIPSNFLPPAHGKTDRQSSPARFRLLPDLRISQYQHWYSPLPCHHHNDLFSSVNPPVRLHSETKSTFHIGLNPRPPAS